MWVVTKLMEWTGLSRAMARLIALGLLFVLLMLTAYSMKACYIDVRQGQNQRKINKQDEKISDSRTQEQVWVDETRKREEEANNAKKEVEERIGSLDDVRRADSSEFNADQRAVLERYCKHRPTDSACRSLEAPRQDPR